MLVWHISGSLHGTSSLSGAAPQHLHISDENSAVVYHSEAILEFCRHVVVQFSSTPASRITLNDIFVFVVVVWCARSWGGYTEMLWWVDGRFTMLLFVL